MLKWNSIRMRLCMDSVQYYALGLVRMDTKCSSASAHVQPTELKKEQTFVLFSCAAALPASRAPTSSLCFCSRLPTDLEFGFDSATLRFSTSSFQIPHPEIARDSGAIRSIRSIPSSDALRENGGIQAPSHVRLSQRGFLPRIALVEVRPGPPQN